MSLVVRVLTVFPDLVESALSEGMVRIARKRGKLDLRAVNVRDFTEDVHRTTDDSPYGGGAGMVMMLGPIVRAFRSLREEERGEVFVLSARGDLFTQETADRWSRLPAITLICGRYKGVDERVLGILDAKEMSLGDFVIPGGELAAAAMVEATARLLPGVLGDADSRAEDSHRESLLGYPDYTRPEVFEGHQVPEVLLSGHHARIAEWRRKRRLETTWKRRPGLLADSVLSNDDRKFLSSLEQGEKLRTGPSRNSESRNPGQQRKE